MGIRERERIKNQAFPKPVLFYLYTVVCKKNWNYLSVQTFNVFWILPRFFCAAVVDLYLPDYLLKTFMHLIHIYFIVV